MLRVAVLGLGLSQATVASPVDVYQLVEWACGGDEPAGLDLQLARDCAAAPDPDRTAACDVVAGDPFACYEAEVTPRDRTCLDSALTLTVSATTGGAGWEVTGTLAIELSRTVTFEGDACSLTERIEGASGEGAYVREAGDANLAVEVTFTGHGSVSFLGLTFGLGFTETCAREHDPVPVRRTNKVACCGRKEASESLAAR